MAHGFGGLSPHLFLLFWAHDEEDTQRHAGQRKMSISRWPGSEREKQGQGSHTAFKGCSVLVNFLIAMTKHLAAAT